MANVQPKTTLTGSIIDDAITLKEIAVFHARGMKRVHSWRLTRMTEFSKFYTYHGEIWATKDGRLLIRFKFRTGLCVETHEICGMIASDLYNIQFESDSDEAAGLKGNTISVRESGKSTVITGSRAD